MLSAERTQGAHVHVGIPDPTHWDQLVGRNHGTGLEFVRGEAGGLAPDPRRVAHKATRLIR